MSFEYSIKPFESLKYFQPVLSLLLINELTIDILLRIDLWQINIFYQYLAHCLLV